MFGRVHTRRHTLNTEGAQAVTRKASLDGIPRNGKNCCGDHQVPAPSEVYWPGSHERSSFRVRMRPWGQRSKSVVGGCLDRPTQFRGGDQRPRSEAKTRGEECRGTEGQAGRRRRRRRKPRHAGRRRKPVTAGQAPTGTEAGHARHARTEGKPVTESRKDGDEAGAQGKRDGEQGRRGRWGAGLGRPGAALGWPDATAYGERF
jgi:hypothetical protein